ncbi:MAG: prenyltransferase/squalene oxidase repeat-containing protein [Halobacteriota archaeon]
MRKSLKKKILGLTLFLFLMLSLSIPLSVSTASQQHYPLNTNDAEIQNALGYLHTLQNDDGGFSNPGDESAVSNTEWTIMAIVAAGEDPHDWKKNGHTPIDYLRANADNLTGSTDYERMILALVAAGENPRDFAGRDFVAELKEKYLKDDGQFSDFTYTTIWGILALSSAGEDVSTSVKWLKGQQNDDGGFAWVPGEKSDYDDTAAAIEALIAAGVSPDSTVIKNALEYLKTGQNTDGGFKYFGTSSSNAASDAWVVQAIVACGQDPLEWTKNNYNSVDHLLSLQQSDGSFNYTAYVKSNPGYMTVCAIIALLGSPYPIKPPLQSKPTPTPTPTILTPTPTATPTTSTSTPTPASASAPLQPTPTSTVTEKPPTSTTDVETAGFGFLSGIIGLLATAFAFVILCTRKEP